MHGVNVVNDFKNISKVDRLSSDINISCNHRNKTFFCQFMSRNKINLKVMKRIYSQYVAS